MLYDVRSITDKKTPGHGTINVICLPEISSDAVSLRKYGVRFFYYGQLGGHHVMIQFIALTRSKLLRSKLMVFQMLFVASKMACKEDGWC